MARKALELDDTLAEAHTSLAWVSVHLRLGLAGRGGAVRSRHRLNPGYSVARQWHSWFLMAMGRTAAALAEGRRAIELDPASVSIRRSMGWLYYYARQPTRRRSSTCAGRSR